MIQVAGRYDRCPKCSHSPLPADQSLPAACPSCGLILAKFGAAPPPMAREPEGGGIIGSYWQKLTAAITYIPDQTDAMMLWARAALLVVFAIWGMSLIGLNFRTGDINNSFLHRPLLVFHEAGHVVFMPFGEFLTIAGGTLGQLIMPMVLCGALLFTNRDNFGAAIGLWLFGVSLLDVAPYAYDALEPQLILLGGHTGEEGGHDWIYLLRATHLLGRAQGIGWFIHKLGVATLLLSLYWAGWVLWQQRKVLLASKDAAEGAGPVA